MQLLNALDPISVTFSPIVTSLRLAQPLTILLGIVVNPLPIFMLLSNVHPVNVSYPNDVTLFGTVTVFMREQPLNA